MTALSSDKTIAIIGCGTMGAGIAQVAAAAGHPVLMYDAQPDSIQRGIDSIAKGLDRLVARGKYSQTERDALLNRLSPCETLEQLTPAALVIEAIVEKLEVKQQLFAQLETLLAEDAILATNTSSISITAIGAALQRPSQLAGMHFFNPAPIMKLVEVVSGLATDQQVADTLFDTARHWGKKAVYARSTPGFIVNRVARPFYAEALRVLDEGGSDIATIDAILRDTGGFRMGPFELMDLIGHDVNYAVTESVWQAYYNDRRFLPSLIQKELVDAGFLGRKSGRGFYHYRDDTSVLVPSSAAAQPAPDGIEIHGSCAAANQLVKLAEAAGLNIQHQPADQLQIKLDNVTLLLTDGQLASQRAAIAGIDNLVLFDQALNYRQCSRIVLAAADQCSEPALQQAIGFWQALGKTVSVIDDIPGLVVARTVAMLANEAADAVNQNVCSVADADIAMQAGVNYPQGPLQWADQLGIPAVVELLDNLAHNYGEDRYRTAMLLRRKSASGQSFYAEENPS